MATLTKRSSRIDSNGDARLTLDELKQDIDYNEVPLPSTRCQMRQRACLRIHMTRIAILLLATAANLSAALAQSTQVLEHSRQIDHIVVTQLEQINQESRPGIDDFTFCRRVYLDAIGRIPTVDELDQFIADEAPDKRSRLINTLLDSKGYQSHWYNYWADLFRVKYVGDKLHHLGN